MFTICPGSISITGVTTGGGDEGKGGPRISTVVSKVPVAELDVEEDKEEEKKEEKKIIKKERVEKQRIIGCGEWEICEANYDLSYADRGVNLIGYRNRECMLDDGSVISQREVCNPTASINIEKVDDGHLKIIDERTKKPAAEIKLADKGSELNIDLFLDEPGVLFEEPLPKIEKVFVKGGIVTLDRTEEDITTIKLKGVEVSTEFPVDIEDGRFIVEVDGFKQEIDVFPDEAVEKVKGVLGENADVELVEINGDPTYIGTIEKEGSFFGIGIDVDWETQIDTTTGEIIGEPTGPWWGFIITDYPTEFCGNGIIESLEQCDDANTIGEDGCSSSCAIEPVMPEPPVDECFITCCGIDLPDPTCQCKGPETCIPSQAFCNEDSCTIFTSRDCSGGIDCQLEEELPELEPDVCSVEEFNEGCSVECRPGSPIPIPEPEPEPEPEPGPGPECTSDLDCPISCTGCIDTEGITGVSGLCRDYCFGGCNNNGVCSTMARSPEVCSCDDSVDSGSGCFYGDSECIGGQLCKTKCCPDGNNIRCNPECVSDPSCSAGITGAVVSPGSPDSIVLPPGYPDYPADGQDNDDLVCECVCAPDEPPACSEGSSCMADEACRQNEGTILGYGCGDPNTNYYFPQVCCELPSEPPIEPIEPPVDECSCLLKADCDYKVKNEGWTLGEICDPSPGSYTCCPPAEPPTPECTANSDCDDENMCNGKELCRDGQCQAGLPLDCNDDDVCTSDGCDSASGCFNNEIISCGAECTTNSDCDDDNVCNGDEQCVDGSIGGSEGNSQQTCGK